LKVSSPPDHCCRLRPPELHFHRYRQVPPFGSHTIRRFTSNCSELKKLAAWDYEDLLQVYNRTILCLRARANIALVFHTCFRLPPPRTSQSYHSEVAISAGVLAWISKTPNAYR
jgi:hypothetical protein